MTQADTVQADQPPPIQTGEKAPVSNADASKTEAGFAIASIPARDESQLLVQLDEHEDPKKWPLKRKWKTIFSISSFVLMSPVSSTLVAPCLDPIAQDFNITESAVKTMVLSIFVLGFTFGPLIASPLSEIYGRTRVVQSWNVVFLIFNTACGAAPNTAALLTFRFIAGLFGSATLGIGGGTLSDLFTAKDRGKAVAIYSIAPLLGPVLGPIIGGVLVQHATWHWAFYTVSILDAIVQLIGVLCLEETYAPVLLRRKQMRLNPSGIAGAGRTWPEVRAQLATNLGRAGILLGTQPIVQVMAVYNAFLYGVTFIIYSTYSGLWTEVYGESSTMSGLHYIALAIGVAFGTQVCTRIQDRIFAFLQAKHNGEIEPEYRIPIMVPATIVLAVGIIWYGWSANYVLFWIMPDIGCALFIAGGVVCGIAVNAYIIDAFGNFSASALAAVATLRCLASFGFPLFAPSLFDAIGYGWAGTMLGLIALVIGLPAAIMFWYFGRALRRRGPQAAFGN